MSKKLYFLISFVLVLSLASASYCGDAKVDFDDPEDPCVEPGWVGATLDDAYIEVNGIIIDFIDADYLGNRRRPDPNSVWSMENLYEPVNEEDIHRDFIYAPAQTNITFRIWGLGANQEAEIHIWAFDEMSENTPRRCDWFANGDYLLTTEFMGGIPFDWPCLGSSVYEHYDFSATATADELGSILFTCDINELGNSTFWPGTDPAVSEPYAFLNGLEVYPQGTPTPVLKAHRPVPFDESENAPIDGTLSWIPGDGSATCNVYLSQDFDDVNNNAPAAKITPTPISANSITPANYLEMDKVYYWRVNVVTPTPVQGNVWSFRTANNLVVDDFEAYGFTVPYITDRWCDYSCNGTSSEVYEDIDYALDNQSMRYRYLNARYYPYYSEASFDLTQTGVDIDTDFDSMNVQAVSIWFYGETTNTTTEQMYAKLSDGTNTAKVDYNGSMSDIQEEEWHEWNIAISEFTAANSINLSDVREITIGFDEGLPADGNVYFDDIRLYTYRCVKVYRSAALAEADFAPVSNEDCVVDNEEVGVIARDWLAADFKTDTCSVFLTDPNLVLYTNFDDYNDLNSVPREQFENHYATLENPIDHNDVNGVMATRNLAPNPHPNSVWLLLSPIDPCDPDTEGPVIIQSPGVGSIITGMDDGSCVHFETDEGDPGERVHCGRWPAVGKFQPGPGTYGTGTAFQGKGELTVAIWAKWGGQKIRPKCQGLISKRWGWNDDELIWMFEVDTIPGPRSSFSLRQRFGNYCLYSAAGIMDLFIGQWVHLAAVADITNDSNEAILYLNGAEVQRGPFYFSGGDPYAITLTIGQDSDIDEQGVENFKGELDEAYVFNRALEPNEVAYLADSTPSDGELAVPVPSAANVINIEPQGQRYVNLADFAVMANQWLKKEYWP